MDKELAYRFRLEPADEQKILMRQFAGCRRLAWNKCLALQKERLDAGLSVLSYAKMTALLPGWKKELPFLADCHSQPLQQVLRDLRAAFDRFFDPKLPDAGFPDFKKKFRSKESFRYPQDFQLDNRRIFLPKIGWMRFRKSRAIEGEINSVTISEYAGLWYASIQCTIKVERPPMPTATGIIGGDAGVVRLYTMSDGTVFFPITETQKWDRVLRKLQRKLSRKVKGSNSWKALKARIAVVYAKIANIRRDVLNKISTLLCKNHAAVVLEDLNVKNMTASAKGTVEAPGKNAKQKAGLNRAILNHGWGQLKRMLEYKMLWAGGSLILVPPHYTSQRCLRCGHVHTDNRVSHAFFHCTACGLTMNADENAARNILAAGHAVLATPASDAVMSPASGTPAASLALE